jgi:hypothetical protein
MTLKIPGQRRSLRVEIDSDSGVFLFAGVSLPENTNTFFSPVIEEIESYLKKPLPKTVINFYIEYLNTSSALFLRRIVMACEEALGGENLLVNWHYEADDEDIKEFGFDFKLIFKNVDVQVIEVTEPPL